MSTQNLQEFCAVLNKFALSRAIVDFERHCFIAWNQKFLEQTGYSEDEIPSVKPEELLTFSETWFPLWDEKESRTVKYIPCAAKCPFGADAVPGYIVRSQDNIGYVMLQFAESPSAQFQQGRIAGREEERNRVRTAFHEEVSSSIIAALFLIEMAKSELEKAGSSQAEAVSKASDILTDATKKIAEVIGDPDGDSE